MCQKNIVKLGYSILKHCPQGKKFLGHSQNLKFSKFEILKLRTWHKLGVGSDLALGRVERKFLNQFFGSRLGGKHFGFCMA
jgi:hypothetical protein